MIVGIVDLDLLLNRSNYQLNLDVMQLSAYYKQRNYRVKLSYSMKLEDLELYNLIFVIYNGDTDIFIDKLASDERTVLIGKYFYHDRSALPQEVIDTYPDRTIYDSLLKSNFLSKTRATELSVMLYKADFLRIHEKSNLNFISKDSTQLVAFDLNISEFDQEFFKQQDKRFTFYYPLKIRSLKSGLNWLEIQAFTRNTKGHMFIAEGFIEQDLIDYLELPYAKRKMFLITFGNYQYNFYIWELKSFIKFAQKAKTLVKKPRILVHPINDANFQFLFDVVRRWYGSSRDNLNVSIFKYGFSKPEHFRLMTKIKAKDPELAQLLSSTLYTRYKNEQARNSYRRVD